MPLFDIPWLSESIKKRALRYLLQRYLGNFLLEKLTLDQLSIDLYNGCGAIRDLLLDVDGLNEELKFIPFKFLEGSIDELKASVPWTALLTEACTVVVEGATFVCQLVTPLRDTNAGDSSYLSRSLMTSSMQIAEDIVNEEEDKFDGLEMFAQLIDSVLRRIKLTATNLSIKIVAPKKSGDGQEMEFRVKHMRCEEEEPIGDQHNDHVNLVEESLTKVITLEGVELLVNGSSISKLSGRHSIKIKIDENKSDTQIYVGSYVLSILTAKQFQAIIDFFDKVDHSPIGSLTGDKLMSSQDYARIEQQLQMDTAFSNMNTASAVCSTSLALGPNKWSVCGPTEYEPTFLPLHKFINDERERDKSNEPKQTQYSCRIKIPGLVLCLISDEESAYSMPLTGVPIFESNSFDSINEYLNGVLDDYCHIRLLSSHLLFDFNPKSFSIVCGDIMINEQTKNTLSPVFWSGNKSKVIDAPRLRFNVIDDTYSITLGSSCFRIDPTFVERYHNYFIFNNKDHTQSSAEFKIHIKCENLNAELLIPVPDLRDENIRPKSSELRSDSIILNLIEYSLLINKSNCEMKCSKFTAALKNDDSCINIITAQSVGTELIKLKINYGTSGVINTTLNDAKMNAILNADMNESIYFDQNQYDDPQYDEPFQIKDKNHTNGDTEQIITPGDNEHLEKFMETVASYAQLVFELTIPTADVNFQNKDQFELIYNLIGNDLSLWVPYPQPNSKKSENVVPHQPIFFTCKHGMSESYESDSSFHSADHSVTKLNRSVISCIFNINDLTFNMGTKDDCLQTIFAQNVFLGLAIGLGNDMKTSVCLYGDNVSLKSNGETIISNNHYNDKHCNLSMAVDILRESKELKKIKFAIQLSNAVMYEIQITNLEKFWGFVNVTDEIVIGYVAPKVITELHINVVDCAITLENQIKRPVLITCEKIYLTSMVVENTNEVLLRIIADETLLCFRKNKTSLEVLKSYVCVVEAGLIDLNLKICHDDRLQFKVSNNAIDIRVCADSFTALCQLIESLSNNANKDNVSDFGKAPFNDDKKFDDGLIEDAMGEDEEHNDDTTYGSDDEPPKFCSCDNINIDESGFWILGDDDLGAGIKMSSEPQIRVLTSETIKVMENHFRISCQKLIPEVTSATIVRYLLEEMTLFLHLYDGRDFEDDDIVTNDNEKLVNNKSGKFSYSKESRVSFNNYTGSVTGWDSLNLTSDCRESKQNASHMTRITNEFKMSGGIKRHNNTCVRLSLSKVKALYENFDDTVPIAWRFYFFVHEISIIDCVDISIINKILYEHCSESMPRRRHVNMVSVKVTSYRNSSDNREECDLRISIKPLRINIDQDTLMFLGEFFSTVIAMLNNEDTNMIKQMIPQETSPPIYNNVNVNFNNCSDAIDIVNEGSNLNVNATPLSVSSNKKVFIKSFSFIPEVPIRLDYHGKRVDFEMGTLKGLFLGLAQLNQSELRLKRLHNKHGILGFDKVLSYAINEWTKDIKRNQLPSLLGGVGPMHSFIQMFQGVRDLFWLPIDQYRRDKRVVRGLQRGALSFTSSTAMGALDLANRFVHLIQSTAQFAHDLVTPPTPGHHQMMQIAPTQPRDLREGMAAAYTVMREGIHDTVRGVTTAGMAADDMSGAIGVVVRQIPSTLIRPVILASQATSNVFVGMRNQLTPDARKDDHDKWKNATDR